VNVSSWRQLLTLGALLGLEAGGLPQGTGRELSGRRRRSGERVIRLSTAGRRSAVEETLETRWRDHHKEADSFAAVPLPGVRHPAGDEHKRARRHFLDPVGESDPKVPSRRFTASNTVSDPAVCAARALNTISRRADLRCARPHPAEERLRPPTPGPSNTHSRARRAAAKRGGG
jgi:hypothetical protein